ncbi:MAG: hypothetical protein K9J16_15960 [Melioribacteraceae bacterium]|nr:hypothetical protein [Melioribacteraceae bacterium]MCF8356129.1 hypothetical protein [Melioribacteraceae bacterium]MCF8395477.1 hypothetical protein [Melioribacteraceae bacterium]MCF8420817.1 hypothetical protein [Melioribacteraceae bacterium]
MKYLRYFFLTVIFSIFIISCSAEKEENKSAAKKKEIAKHLITQEDKEEQKAGKNEVKTRYTRSYFYKSNGEISDRGYLIEEVNYDENGNKIEHIRYKSDGSIDLKWTYKYDEAGNVIEKTSTDVFESTKFQQNSKFDNNGNEIERTELNLKKRGNNIYEFEYNDSGLLKSVEVRDPSDNIVTREEFIYDDSLVVLEKIFTPDLKGGSEIKYNYDDNNLLIQKVKSVPDLTVDTTNYAYDESGNLIEKDAGYFIHKYEYNENNDLTMEEMFDGAGGLQYRFKYMYNQRGLLSEKIRYDGLGSPALYIKYDYEFH